VNAVKPRKHTYATSERQDRRSRPQRWTEAVETLQELQEQYHEWLTHLPRSRHDSALAAKLRVICDLDLAQLDVELPLGFGRG
jgi:hypothetical protein